MEIIDQVPICCMPVRYIHIIFEIIKWHDERNMFNAKIMLFTEYIDETFTHVAINPTLDRIINGRDSPFHLKENVKEPF